MTIATRINTFHNFQDPSQFRLHLHNYTMGLIVAIVNGLNIWNYYHLVQKSRHAQMATLFQHPLHNRLLITAHSTKISIATKALWTILPFKYGSILMAVTDSPDDFIILPMLLIVIPFPNPLTTPPVITRYFIIVAALSYRMDFMM